MRMSLSAFAGVIAVGICCSASAASLPPILKNTIMHSGNGNGMKLVVGNNTLDSATIHCEDKFGNGCFISVNTMVELLPGDGQWKICPTVDGVAMDPTCPIQGVTNGGGSSTVTGTGWSNKVVAAGMHTVTAIISIHNANNGLHSWQVSYLNWAKKKP